MDVTLPQAGDMRTEGEETPNSALAAILGKRFEEFVRYQNMKDMPGILRCLHGDSFGRLALEKSFEALFDRYTLQVSILERTYIGSDGFYACYRFQQKIEKIAGPEFTDMLAENLVVFRQQNDEWKIWNCFPLWMRPA